MLGDIKDPAGQGSEQFILDHPALSKGTETNNFQRSPPTSAIL